MLRASELVVFDGRTLIARHERSTVRGSATLLLDHYLEVLVSKPGALPGATALAQARAAGSFTAAHEAFWAPARKAGGDAAGTRELVDVLLLHRPMSAGDVVGGITAALAVGTGPRRHRRGRGPPDRPGPRPPGRARAHDRCRRNPARAGGEPDPAQARRSGRSHRRAAGFTDPRLCAAIVDRLTYGGHIIETGTDSYRLAATLAQRATEAHAATQLGDRPPPELLRDVDELPRRSIPPPDTVDGGPAHAYDGKERATDPDARAVKD